MNKPRIAVIVPGGVGGGDFSQGYPPMMIFLNKLSVFTELTVYSIHPVKHQPEAMTYKVKSPPHWLRSSKLRMIFLIMTMVFDQIRKPYHVMHGFWVYPAGTLAVILGKIFRVVSITTVQGGEAAAIPEIPYGNMLTPRLKKITLWTCEHATCLNTISTFLVRQLALHGLKRTDAVVIPFGSQRTRIKNVEIGHGELKLIHIANITEVKDQKTLLLTFQKILAKQSATLFIIGGDYMNGEIHRLAAAMGLSLYVKFLGSLPHVQLLPYYFECHIMLHTSLHEGQSGVVTDAMARGVVVCGTRVGIIADLGEQYCQIAEVGDHEQLAKLTLAIWNDQALFNQKRQAAWEWSQRHDDLWTVQKYVTLYETLVK